MLKLASGLIVILFFVSCASSEKKSPGKALSISEQCFQLIIENKTKEFIQRLDQCKEMRNPMGLTPLMLSIAKDNLGLVEALIEADADVNAVDNAGMTALVFAANKNSVRSVQLLRRAGARIEIVNDNLSGLMMAVRNSSLDLVEVMNPTVDEINLRAGDGWTSLYFAISRRDAEILKYLLERGACTQQRDIYQQRPVDFAKEVKWKEGIQLLSRKNRC